MGLRGAYQRALDNARTMDARAAACLIACAIGLLAWITAPDIRPFGAQRVAPANMSYFPGDPVGQPVPVAEGQAQLDRTAVGTGAGASIVGRSTGIVADLPFSTDCSLGLSLISNWPVSTGAAATIWPPVDASIATESANAPALCFQLTFIPASPNKFLCLIGMLPVSLRRGAGHRPIYMGGDIWDCAGLTSGLWTMPRIWMHAPLPL